MSVFFWILIGLTWIGGVVSMLTENLNASMKNAKTVKISFKPTFFKPLWAKIDHNRHKILSSKDSTPNKFTKGEKEKKKKSNKENNFQGKK